MGDYVDYDSDFSTTAQDNPGKNADPYAGLLYTVFTDVKLTH